jgi:hypothetical protein
VDASLFHVIAPAGELGLTTVWINRLDEKAEPKPDRELTDVKELPDTLDELVPAPCTSSSARRGWMTWWRSPS